MTTGPVNQNPEAGFTRWGVWIAVVALVGGMAALLWIWSKSDPSSTADRQPPAFSGEFQQFIPSREPRPAPQTPFTSADGRTVSLADFRGQVALVNFWATWCIPCVEEMPALDRAQAALAGEGVVILPLSSDRGGKVMVEPFYREKGIHQLGLWLDPRGAASRALGARGLPTTLVVDRQGRERARVEGDQPWDSPEILAVIRRLVGPAPAAPTDQERT
jgi:thiol-disulfide isomerase/thioredoxin